MPRHTDTIAALATPAGTAALAVLRASGPDTLRITTEILGRPPLPRVARHTDYRDQAGGLIDDVVLTFFQGPRSYTGEDALEISCHGNPFIAQKIVEDLYTRGCRPAEPGEFTQRAFLNGRMDLSQAEAVMDLIHARSERALAAANQQLRGALRQRMDGLIEGVLEIVARIEAYLDFPEDDLPVEDRDWVLGELARLSAETGRLLATSHYGTVLREGLKTVIVGAPNVGKSSLLNRLVGRDRALVSPEPGTTRDFIEETILVGPHRLRLIDTAGLNPFPTPLEKRGMEKTEERVAEADLLLLVLDGSKPAATQYAAIAALPPIDSLIVFNKSDLCDNYPNTDGPRSPSSGLAVSALTGAGIDTLLIALERRADAFQQDAGSDMVAINARHAHALGEASSALSAARDKLLEAEPMELVASDLRTVLAAFGDIAGRVDHERVLDHLFARFCIGK